MSKAKYISNQFDEEEALMIAKRERRKRLIKKAEQLARERVLGEHEILLEKYIHYLSYLLALAGLLVIGLLWLVMFIAF